MIWMSIRGIVRAKFPQESREPVEGAVVLDSDTDDMINAGVHAPDLVFDQEELFEKLLTEVREVLGRRRHPQPLVGALEQGNAKTALGLFDPVRQRRGGQAERIGGIDDASRAPDRPDHLEVMDIKTRTLHDESHVKGIQQNPRYTELLFSKA